MRILLHNQITGQYLQAPGRWTDSPERAVDFRFADRARKFAQSWSISEVEIVVAVDDDPQYFSAIPLPGGALTTA